MEYNQNTQANSSNVGEDRGMVMPSSSSRTRIQEIMKKRQLSNEQAIEMNKNELAGDTVNMWDYSHNAPDDSQKEKLQKRSNTIGIANMIYDASVREGNTNVPSNTRDIMNMYKEEHPDNWQTVLDAINNTSIDLDAFGVEQGWLPTDEEMGYDGVLGWLRKTMGQGGTFWSGPNMAIQGIQQGIYGIQNTLAKYTGDEPRDTALAEYAYETYGKDLSELTDREIAKLQENLSNPEERAKYEDVLNNEFINLYGGAVDTLFTAAFPGMKLGFSAVDNTPGLNLLSYGLGEVISSFGEVLAGMNPILRSIREQLPNEKQKKIFDASTGGLGMFKAAKNQRVQSMSKYYVQKIADALPTQEVMLWYNNFKNKVNDALGGLADRMGESVDKKIEGITSPFNKAKETGKRVVSRGVKEGAELGKGLYNRIKDEVITPSKERVYGADWNVRGVKSNTTEGIDIAKKQQSEIATKISKGENPRQRQAVSDTLNRLSLSDDRATSRTTTDLTQLRDNIYKNVAERAINGENKLLSKSKYKITPEEIKENFSGTIEKGVDSEGTPYERDPMERAIRAIRKMRKYKEGDMTMEDASYEEFYNDYLKGNSTPLDFYNMARNLTKEFNLYRKNGGGQVSDAVTKQQINDIRLALKSIAKDTIAKQFPELEGALENLDRVYSDAETTMELLDDRILGANAERGKQGLQTPTQEFINKAYKFGKNAIVDTFTNGSKITDNSMNNEINFYLAEHDRAFDMMGREGYDFEDILTKIDELPDIESELVEIEDEVLKTNAIGEYGAALYDLLEGVGTDSAEALKFVKDVTSKLAADNSVQEPLFEIADGGKRVDFLGRPKGKSKK